MRVAYISDIHLDFYIKASSSPNKLKRFLLGLFDGIKKVDVLIVAGDISHYNSQIVAFLHFAKAHAANVVFVGGNHECYNISRKMKSKYTTPYARLEELKGLVENIPNIYMLDGNSVTIDGKVFAGAMGWYDGSYYYKMGSYSPYSENIMSFWCSTSNDSRAIPDLYNFMDMFDEEIKKIKQAVSLNPDVMVTHFCPTSEVDAISTKYRFDRATGFYTFDGEAAGVLNNVPIWVHGHLHDKREYTVGNTRFLRNPVGYPRENRIIGIEVFDI